MIEEDTRGPNYRGTAIQAIDVLDHGFVAIRNISGPTRRQLMRSIDPLDGSGCEVDMLRPFDADDIDPANSARMSFGGMDSGRTREQDLKLAEYLIKNKHNTPIEMIEIWLEMKMPIFVARQLVRHRTCLAGDTVVSFELPSGKVDGSVRHHPVTIERLYRNWNIGAPMTDRWGYKRYIDQKDRISGMQLRCYDASGVITTDRILDIWCAGEKPVFKITFDNGSTLTATEDHKVFTDRGWIELREAVEGSLDMFYAGNAEHRFIPEFPVIDLSLEEWRDVAGFAGKYEVSSLGRVRSLLNTRNRALLEPEVKRQTITPSGYAVISLSEDGKSRSRLVHHLVLEAFSTVNRGNMEARHLNSNSLDNRACNLEWGTPVENSSDRKISGAKSGLCLRRKKAIGVEYLGIQPVYDMATQYYHNFFANNTLVHNCTINEISGRYVTLPAEWYIPEVVGGKPINAKQGQSDTLEEDTQEWFRQALNTQCEHSYVLYLKALESGVAAEHARMFLHLNHYTHWLFKMDLHNMFHFLSLRDHSHAQIESQQYAKAVDSLLRQFLPDLMGMYDKYRRME